MTYAQLDQIADAINPLLGVAVVGGALYLQRARAWDFLLRATLATLIVQQSAKWVQHMGWLGPKFPSTHFAVALCLVTMLALLHRRLAPAAAAIAIAYGALMLWQHYHPPLEMLGAPYVYHTPLEMLGAIYAVPLTFLAQRIGRRARVESAPN